jgi:hypothetical protein
LGFRSGLASGAGRSEDNKNSGSSNENTSSQNTVNDFEDAPEWVREMMSPDSDEGSTLAYVAPALLPLPAIDGPLPIGEAVAAVVAAVAITADLALKGYITYEIYNPAINTYYVGRASGFGTSEQIFSKRFNNHKWKSFIEKNGGKASIDQTIYSYPAGKWAIRGREQQLYDYHLNLGHKMANISDPIFYYHPYAYFYHTMSNVAFGEIAPYSRCMKRVP